MTTPLPDTPSPRSKSRTWIWFFVVLGLLCATAITIIWVYNLSIQLTENQLETAEALWEEHGPRSYEIKYTKIIAGMPSERIEVRVIDGTVTSATLNDLPIDDNKLKYYDVRGMFHDLKAFLEERSRSGNFWVSLVAIFDAQDGHPVKYVRRVMGSNQRVEVRVMEFRALPARDKGKVK
jgi:hypothetical protein